MAALQAASNTSLTLPPAASPIAFRRASVVACVATRRWGVTLTLNIVRGASASEAKSGSGLSPTAAWADPSRPRNNSGNARAWFSITLDTAPTAPSEPVSVSPCGLCGRSAAQTGGVSLDVASPE